MSPRNKRTATALLVVLISSVGFFVGPVLLEPKIEETNNGYYIVETVKNMFGNKEEYTVEKKLLEKGCLNVYDYRRCTPVSRAAPR